MTHILMKEQLMATKFSPDQLSEIIDKQLARPGVLAVLLPRAEAERVVQLLDDLAGRLADETATAAALSQLEATL